MASNAVRTCTVTTKRKSNNYCCVPQCSSYYTDSISMHGFPRLNPSLCKTWQIRLKIGKPITPFMKVCSKHFDKEDFILPDYVNKRRCLKKCAVPSRNLPVGSIDRRSSNKTTELIQARSARTEKRQLQKQIQIENAANEVPDVPESNKNYSEPDIDAVAALLLLSSASVSQTKTKTYEEKSIQVNTFIGESMKFDVSDIVNSEYRLKMCTGVNNFALFNTIVDGASNLCQSSTTFCRRKQVLLTLMKIKLCLTFRFLAIIFNISESSARNYFISNCKILGVLLKYLVRFPSKEEILQNMPKCFRKYRKCRIVLDCTEIAIGRSKCLKCRVRSYSSYKGNHTCKFLIGVAPSGMITYISAAYGGRASDKAIFNRERLIEKFLPGQDAIMVDKGFLIESECTENFIQLIRPPFLGRKKKQFSKEDATKTAEIARAWVHVERSIQRLKNFALLKHRLPFSLLPYVNNIMIIVAGLVNLSEPILVSNKF